VGKSILLITDDREFLSSPNARWRPSASTPCAASTISNAPSHALKLRDTVGEIHVTRRINQVQPYVSPFFAL
jgi:hypothetical protein